MMSSEHRQLGLLGVLWLLLACSVLPIHGLIGTGPSQGFPLFFGSGNYANDIDVQHIHLFEESLAVFVAGRT